MLRDETHARLGACTTIGVDPTQDKFLAQHASFTVARHYPPDVFGHDMALLVQILVVFEEAIVRRRGIRLLQSAEFHSPEAAGKIHHGWYLRFGWAKARFCSVQFCGENGW